MSNIFDNSDIDERLRFYSDERSSILNEKVMELKKINDIYDEKLKASSQNIKYLKALKKLNGKLIEKYGTFNTEQIGNAVVKLLNELENCNYKLDFVNIKSVRKTPESYNENIDKAYIITDKSSTKKNYYIPFVFYDFYVKELEKQGVILFDVSNFIARNKEEKIRFYDDNKNRLKEFKYDLIYKFIDSLINYRYENKLDEISEDEINFVLNNYIKENKQVSKKLKKYKSPYINIKMNA